MNPRGDGKEHCKAIILRSGKIVESSVQVGDNEQERQKAKNSLEESIENEHTKNEIVAPSKEDTLRIPHPQRLRKSKLDGQFTKFLEVFKKLHINISFVDVLEKMSGYVKFIKDILSKKSKLGGYETMALSEECTTILQKKLPPKIKDPDNFTIPCAIGNSIFERALYDLSESINLMSLSIFKKINLGDASPTIVTMQFADRSLTHPRSMIEDVLVKVDKFIFQDDFIILDMEEDKEILITLGRPFLATSRALINLQKGELSLRVQEEEVTFNVCNAIKHPFENDNCFNVDVIEAIVSSQVGSTDPLETSLLHENLDALEDEEVKNYLLWMDSFEPNRRKYFEDLGASLSCPIPSIEQPPILEGKPLPTHLRYSYLGASSALLFIISYLLSQTEEERLLRVLHELKGAISWSLADIKGI